jgi:hypothetical protein
MFKDAAMSNAKMTKKFLRASTVAGSALVFVLATGSAWAGDREQAKRIHDRLAGVPPTDTVLNCMELMIGGNNLDPTSNDCPDSNTDNDTLGAAYLAMENKNFYNVTLKNFITPWTNEEQTVFAPLNDYTATVIGVIRDDLDFRRILFDDILYIDDGTSGVTPYDSSNNDHYTELEDQGADLKAVLTQTSQSGEYNLPSGSFPASAAAGVMTTRQGAKAFFVDGTNRAMFRFTLLNHLCQDLEQIKDTSRTTDRIRQDVSRSPGGDSRIFMNACVGCHSGMDPMVQSYAYFDYEYPVDPNNGDPYFDQGAMVYNNAGVEDVDKDGNPTGTRVQAKYHINANNFEYGYHTPDDHWDNYWREGPNSALGWDSGLPGTGSGAKSMGQELAYTEAFARCQVEKVFQAVCLRAPVDVTDRDQIDTMITSFKANGYKLKQVFAESAVFCMGD